MDIASARSRLASVVRRLAVEQRAELDRLKAEYHQLSRPDFLWHYLLQSFATMGRASGWHGLIGNQANYRRVTYETLATLTPEVRASQVKDVCRTAAIRMPDRKAAFILGCFNHLKRLGGPGPAKARLLGLAGRDGKIQFLQTFPGIGPKYARNIMMDVYHEDFRDSIAVDIRIKAISERLGLSFASYENHEEFYLSVARQAGVNGWELDRLLFTFRPIVEARLGLSLDVHDGCIKDRSSLPSGARSTSPTTSVGSTENTDPDRTISLLDELEELGYDDSAHQILHFNGIRDTIEIHRNYCRRLKSPFKAGSRNTLVQGRLEFVLRRFKSLDVRPNRDQVRSTFCRLAREAVERIPIQDRD